MNDYLLLILGIVFAGVGGELFVRGSVALATAMRISAGIVGATVAAFATSSPELAVSVTAAAAGKPQISLGDVLGSNVVNIALLLGLALSFSGIQCPKGSLKRDFPLALVAPLVTGILLLDGILSRLDGMALIGLFLVWIIATIREVRKQRNAASEVLATHHPARVAAYCVGGLLLLLAAGGLIVSGARGIASSFGIPEFIIGATIVALGTSAPELATIIISRFRGHDEIGLGTLLGSNIFNGLFVVGIAALICPIVVEWQSALSALGFGVVALVATFPSRDGFISRRRGWVLLCLYAIYIATAFQTGASPNVEPSAQ